MLVLLLVSHAMKISKCVSEDLQFEDAKLNASYSALRKALNTKDKEQLKIAQLHWISFRVDIFMVVVFTKWKLISVSLGIRSLDG